ncbi:MAG: lipoyl synthase [Candidatus Omnitrophica bacterium]|nr:lipoyl synthase [Candidatus Omnitrophota bacterium]
MKRVLTQEAGPDVIYPADRAGRLPAWLRRDIPDARAREFGRCLADSGVSTVCVEAHCPNIARCFRRNTATFLILGKTCTRSCRFCIVQEADRHPLPVDTEEPRRICAAIERFGIMDAVITSVTRDDLPDGGAGQFARVIASVRALVPPRFVEVLIPDFLGSRESLRIVARAQPDVIAHNIETVRRLYPCVRPQADYRRSLEVLKTLKDLAPAVITKSSLMLGLSEKEEEVVEAMQELRQVDCDCLMLGQYLAPSSRHISVKEFIEPRVFQRYKGLALAMGFKTVVSGPFVRSSYRGEDRGDIP